MSAAAPVLAVRRITRAAAPAARGVNHKARLVVEPDAYERQSPFLLLAEDWFAPPAGFPRHPHRGMETVTFVLEGELEHRDHTGARGRLAKGDVQFMTAGAGVMHSEMPGPGGVHSLQLWLNLPAAQKFAPAGYRDVPLASAQHIERSDCTVTLYAGSTLGKTQPFASTWPMTLMDTRLAAGETLELDLPPRLRAFAYVIEGEVAALPHSQPARAGEVIWFETAGAQGGALALRSGAQKPGRALIYAAEPIYEPAVFGSPFVMNSHKEIEEAFDDLRNGRLTA